MCTENQFTPEQYAQEKKQAVLVPEQYPPTDIRSTYKGLVVAVGGPPHSGKSVFLAELYRQLLARNSSGVFLQRACPDGEGMWSAESDPELVKEIRRKGSFSPEFMNFTIKGIENLGKRFPIVLLDLGGRRSAENGEILKRATHSIILSSKEDEIQPWHEFGEAEGCRTLAVFDSQLVKTGEGNLDNTVRSTADMQELPLRGHMFNLDRDLGSDTYGGAIGDVAEWLTVQAQGYVEAVRQIKNSS